MSTSEQASSGLGLDAQMAAITATAATLGLPLGPTFTDAGVSGTVAFDRRPGLAAALNALRRGDVLCVGKRDRIARDSFIAVLVEREVAKKGARVVSCGGEGTGGDDPASIFTRRILDAVAELERSLTAARTKAALGALKARGHRSGGIPYGSQLHADGRTLVPHDGELHALTVLRDLRERGFSTRATAAALNAQGFTTRAGSAWAHQYVNAQDVEAVA